MPHSAIGSLVNQSPDFIEKIVSTLAKQWQQRCKGPLLLDTLKNMYAEEISEDAFIFNNFLYEHAIEVIGIGNSLTFKCTNIRSGENCVLRLEYAMGDIQLLHPDTKKQQALNNSGLVTPIHQASFSIQAYKRKQDRPLSFVKVMVMDLAEGVNLTDRFCNTEISKNERYTQCAGDILKMASGFLGFLKQGIYSPDGKCSNWIRKADGSLCVADQKSLIQMDKANALGNRSIATILTPGYYAPEMPSTIPAKFGIQRALKANAFTLGANLYYYLTATNKTGEHEPSTEFSNWPFDKPIFQGEIGKKYKQLILNLIKENSEDRMNLEDAVKELKSIKQLMEQSPDAYREKCDVITKIQESAKQYLTKNSFFNFKSKKAIPKYFYLDKLQSLIAEEMGECFTRSDLAKFIREKHAEIMKYVKDKVEGEGKYSLEGTSTTLKQLSCCTYEDNIEIGTNFKALLSELTGEDAFSPCASNSEDEESGTRLAH